jgi:hypothetical protein
MLDFIINQYAADFSEIECSHFALYTAIFMVADHVSPRIIFSKTEKKV